MLLVVHIAASVHNRRFRYQMVVVNVIGSGVYEVKLTLLNSSVSIRYWSNIIIRLCHHMTWNDVLIRLFQEAGISLDAAFLHNLVEFLDTNGDGDIDYKVISINCVCYRYYTLNLSKSLDGMLLN